jgi:hypothetical protein
MFSVGEISLGRLYKRYSFCRLNSNACRSFILPGVNIRESEIKNILPTAINGFLDFVRFAGFFLPERVGERSLYERVNSRYAACRVMHIPVVFL